MRTTIALVFLLLISNIGSAENKDKKVGFISDVEGEASIINASGEKKCGLGLYVEVGDRIITQNNARIKIMMLDDSLLTIAPKTEFVIDNYLVDTNKKSRRSLIGIIRGKIMFYVNKAFSNPDSKFEVKTKTSIAGVRGTKFFYECEESDFVGVFEGEVELSSKDKSVRITDGKCADSKKDFMISQLDAGTIEQYNETFKVKKGKMQVAILNSGTRTSGEGLVEGYYGPPSAKGDSGLGLPVAGKSQERYGGEDIAENTAGRGDVENYGGGDNDKGTNINVGLIPLRIKILLPFVTLKR